MSFLIMVSLFVFKDLISSWINVFGYELEWSFEPFMSMIVKLVIYAVHDWFVTNHKWVHEYVDILFVEIYLTVLVFELVTYPLYYLV